jgi:FkbM family methyltransferase
MIKKIIFFISSKCIFLIEKLIILTTNKSILAWHKEFIESLSYKKIEILNSKINFFVPNHLVEWRVNTFYKAEPETLEWIDSFESKDSLIFWDIGANIGLYSIYNSLKNKNSTTIAFEPSTSNLRVLSRNISINNLDNKIKIFTPPLSNVENKFLTMKESTFQEGGATHSFGESFDFEGKKFSSKMNYKIFGTNINFLIDNKILDIPNYIKIDVDGIEHLILEGGSKYLKDKKIKSLSVEINENFTEQKTKVLDIMKKNNFKILHKKQDENTFGDNSKHIYSRIFNYIFVR